MILDNFVVVFFRFYNPLCISEEVYKPSSSNPISTSIIAVSLTKKEDQYGTLGKSFLILYCYVDVCRILLKYLQELFTQCKLNTSKIR